MSQPGTLPSSEHAQAFIAQPTAENAAQLAVDLAGRALLIAAGIAVLAPRSSSPLKRALAGSAAIELFVLAYTASLTRKDRLTESLPPSRRVELDPPELEVPA